MPVLPSSLPSTVLPPFVTAMIIPTGTGASIGGFAGDATPYMNLLASVSDVLITHPNVANAAVFQKLPDNALYVEGYGFDQFIQGNWALQPVRQNRIGVVFDSAIEPEMLTLHLNTINAAKTVYGLDIVGYMLTREPVRSECTQTPSGCSSGSLKNPGVILEACALLIQQGAEAIALCTQLPELGSAADSEKTSENIKALDVPIIVEPQTEADDPEQILAASTAALGSNVYLEEPDEFADLADSHDEESLHEDDDEQEIIMEVLEGENVEELLRELFQGAQEIEETSDLAEAKPDNIQAESVAAVLNTMLEDTLLVASDKINELDEDSDDNADGVASFSHQAEADYRQGQGVDPIGGLEGILSHLVVSELGVPCAHAPVFKWETAKPVLDEVLNPKAAAEFIAPTFLPCVLTGLNRAPQMQPVQNMHAPYELISQEVSVLVTPANALGGVAVLAAIEQGIPIIAVEENQTVLSMDSSVFASLPPERRRLIRTVRSYEEAAGAVQMLRLGLTANFEPVQKIELT